MSSTFASLLLLTTASLGAMSVSTVPEEESSLKARESAQEKPSPVQEKKPLGEASFESQDEAPLVVKESTPVELSSPKRAQPISSPSKGEQAKERVAYQKRRPRITDPINRRIPTQIVWHESYEEALAEAKAKEKPLLLLFTGSDWCTWCVRLEEEALKTDAFAKDASDKFVFVKLDFPSRKLQPHRVKRQNRKLKRQFGVQGFPTVLIVSPKERVLAETGYESGGGKAYARHLMTMLDP